MMHTHVLEELLIFPRSYHTADPILKRIKPFQTSLFDTHEYDSLRSPPDTIDQQRQGTPHT